MELRAYVDHLVQEMNLCRSLYDRIRLIDPVEKIVHAEIKPDSQSATYPEVNCFGFWHRDHVCQNCVSARSLRLDKPLVKIEFQSTRIFMISTLPVKVGENRAVFELMKDITDSGILGIEDIDTIEMQKIINSRNRKIISDALTRIHNENYIQDRLPYDIARAKKNNEALSLVYVRIENLKAINDKFGSAAGDFTIRELAKKLKYYSHQDNWVARHGVMGFVLLLHQTGEQAGYQICKRIFDKINQASFTFAGNQIQVNISIGLHTLQGTIVETDDFIRLATEKIQVSSSNALNPAGLSGDEFIQKYLLTAREIEIFNQLLSGQANAQIAETLFISLPTVKKHISSIFSKTNVKSRSELLAKYKQHIH